MPRAKHKTKSKDKRDFAEIAFDVVREATKDSDQIVETAKNPAAVALGSMGGRARARNLSAMRRKEIARRAARQRWKRKKA